MKLTKYLSLILFVSLLIISCGKSEENEEEVVDCDFTEELCELKPFCTWPPVPNSIMPLPVVFFYDGNQVDFEEYKFEWSAYPDYRAGAISLRYDDLPITVKVTELATGCEVDLTLTAN